MPFKDNTFEFVFCLDMLEHIPKKDRLLVIQEMIRVSKKHIIIGFPFGEF
jgi:ubiquinone/menaquinone biosynthesis C-methylase UbiE